MNPGLVLTETAENNFDGCSFSGPCPRTMMISINFYLYGLMNDYLKSVQTHGELGEWSLRLLRSFFYLDLFVDFDRYLYFCSIGLCIQYYGIRCNSCLTRLLVDRGDFVLELCSM